MTHFVTLALLLLANATHAVPAAASEVEGEWQLIDQDDGIEVYRKDIPGSRFVAFRGVMVMETTASRVAAVLMNSARKKEWVAKVVEAYSLKRPSDWESVEYNHTKGVFIVSDRDFVFNARAYFEPAKRRIAFRLSSTEDPAMPPRDGIVRGELTQSSYIVTEIEPGKKTRVEVDIHADPKGIVPPFVVNLFQKSWARSTLTGIDRQTKKPDAEDNAKVRDILNGTIKTGFPMDAVETN